MRVKTQLKIIICYRVYGEINIHKRISTRRHTTRYNSQCHVPVANKQEVIENELKTFGQIVRKFCVPTLSISIAKDEPVSADPNSLHENVIQLLFHFITLTGRNVPSQSYRYQKSNVEHVTVISGL